MRIVSASLRNFRCFSSLDLDFEKPIVLIHGPNGSGKTSILEAFHYACYLRSFKTHLPKELVLAQAEGFGVGLGLVSQGFDALSVQFAKSKKTVKLNEQGIGSYKELYEAYRVITITEDDLQIIQGAPSARRSFLDTVVLLLDPSHAATSQKYRAILNNRNALLAKGRFDDESYMLWTEQLLQTSFKIQKARLDAVKQIESEAKLLIRELFPLMADSQEEPLTMDYTYARPYSGLQDTMTVQNLIERYPGLKENELRQKRSLLGAHLDDFVVTYLGKACRTYASRGQQKLVVFLLKMAQLQVLKVRGSTGTILLVDDFMTDFDEDRAAALLPLMTKLSTQVILTSPLEGIIKNKLPLEITQSIDLAKLGNTSKKKSFSPDE